MTLLFRLMVGTAVGSLATAGTISTAPEAIILMLGDDYGYNNVGFAHGPLAAGNPEMRTPNMDSLVADGIVLERHYVFKYCSPTRSSLMSGRVPPHVNQNNLNNDIEATSGVDLRFKFLAEKMREAGYSTAMIGKSHLGARSPANLPINRGFDVHFGFLKGGEDHYSQGSGSQDGEGPGTVDLWDGHGISNRTGIYSGYNYAQRAVEVIANYTATTTAARAAGNDAENGLFMYLAWHNTHTPLECPEEWMYPATYNNSDSARMTYNCMARILDDGIGNVTSALKAGGVWDKTLIIFAADNGGWVGNTGSNNYPLKGSKVSDFEGGVRAVSFVSGGYLPINVRGSHHSGLIAVADWYGTLCNLVGVSPTDDVPGLPPVDSNDFWSSILIPDANTTGRTELFLSWSCTASSANLTGCDPSAPSIYNTSGDPTANQGPGDMALISNQYKIILGQQEGRGIWFGPVYPNGTQDHPAYPCAEGCLYDIYADPTEHVNLKDTMPSVYASMLAKLVEHGKTVYQTAYAEPGTEKCLTGAQARAYYVGHDTCIPGSPTYNPCSPTCNASLPKYHLGPMCFHTLPPVPPSPPVPPPRPPPTPPPGPPTPVFTISLSGSSSAGNCLVTSGQTFSPITLVQNCDDAKHWTKDPSFSSWIKWAGARTGFIKVSEQNASSPTAACERGVVYVNDAESKSGATHQGFTVKTLVSPAVQLVSSLCPGMCLGYATSHVPADGDQPRVLDCASARDFIVGE